MTTPAGGSSPRPLPEVPSEGFSKTFEVRWADLDPNRHLRHTSYNDYATHVRFSYLEEGGFGAREFGEHRMGPVIFKEETRYFKEVGMNETITVDFRTAALSAGAERFRMVHDIRRADGQLAATVAVEGAWLDLGVRKLRPAPPALATLLQALPRTEDFEEIPLKR